MNERQPIDEENTIVSPHLIRDYEHFEYWMNTNYLVISITNHLLILITNIYINYVLILFTICLLIA